MLRVKSKIKCSVGIIVASPIHQLESIANFETAQCDNIAGPTQMVPVLVTASRYI